MLGARNTEINWVQIAATKNLNFIEKDTKYKHSLLLDQAEDPSPCFWLLSYAFRQLIFYICPALFVDISLCGFGLMGPLPEVEPPSYNFLSL